MSTADRRSKRRRAAGFTFVEMAVALAIFSLIGLVIERTLTTTHNAERYLSALRRATERGQKVSYEIFDSVSASRKLFQRDAGGEDYLAALDLSRDPLLPGARLPLIDEVNGMGVDATGDPHTGNVLLFVRESDPAPCIADSGTASVRYIDTYRFICIYPHRADRRVVKSRDENALDLIVWRSVPYPSLSQILAIEDVDERSSVVADLFTRYGHTLAWDANEAVDQAFFALDYLGTVSGTPEVAPLIEEDVEVSSRGRLEYANVQLAPTRADSYLRRAVFTTDDPADWEPDGFEVKITGASGSRKVWLHVVVECEARQGETAAHENTMIASTRDL